MKRLLLIGLILCVFAMPAFAGANSSKVVESAHTSANSTSLAVSLTSTVYTKSFPIKSANSELDIGVAYKVDPATGDVAIFFEQSTQRPTTEGSADATYMVTHVVEDVTTNGTWNLATIDTVNLMYGRFKLVGAAANPATSVLSIKYVK